MRYGYIFVCCHSWYNFRAIIASSWLIELCWFCDEEGVSNFLTMSVWFLDNRKSYFKSIISRIVECCTFSVLILVLLMDFIGQCQMVNMCCKTWFFSCFFCGFNRNVYFCTVFFIVLDLRLTKVGVQRNSFFYVRTWGLLFSIRFYLPGFL